MSDVVDQAKEWAGDFGTAYLRRNQVAWQKRQAFWQHIAAVTNGMSALEVGCSAGWNLRALREVGFRRLFGIEINAAAARQATIEGLFVANGSAQQLLPGLFCAFDLVFTAGVLIHVSPKDVTTTMYQIARASSRYVLAVEYAADVETEVKYRGKTDMLWKRDYGRMYEGLGLHLVERGHVDKDEGFDDCTWWLMEKGKAK